MKTTQKSRITNLATVLVLALLGLQLGLVNIHSFNFPNADDFDVYLDFLNKFSASDGFFVRAGHLFKIHSQHYQVLDRTVALAAVQLQGHLDFRLLIGVASVSLVLIYLLLIHPLRREISTNPWLLLPIGLLLYQPQYAEATQWATTSWQFMWANVFALAAFAFSFHPAPLKRSAALAAAILGILTQGNGVFIALAVSVVSLLRRKYREAAVWGSLAFVVFGILHVGSAQKLLPRTGRLTWALDVIDYTISFLGSSLAFNHHWAAFTIGLVLLGWFAVLTYKSFFTSQPALYASILFFILSAAANAFSRIHWGIELSYSTSRYKLVSVLCVIVASLAGYSLLRHVTHRKVFIGLSILLGVIFSACSYHLYFNQYIVRSQLLRDSALRWQLSGDGLPYHKPARARRIFNRSLENGMFIAPRVDETGYVSRKTGWITVTGEKGLVVSIEHVIATDRYLIIDGWALKPGTSNRESRTYVRLSGEDEDCVFTALTRVRTDVGVLFRRKGYDGFMDHAGFFALIDKTDLRGAVYDISIIVSNNGETFLKKTRRTVTVSGARTGDRAGPVPSTPARTGAAAAN